MGWFGSWLRLCLRLHFGRWKGLLLLRLRYLLSLSGCMFVVVFTELLILVRLSSFQFFIPSICQLVCKFQARLVRLEVAWLGVRKLFGQLAFMRQHSFELSICIGSIYGMNKLLHVGKALWDEFFFRLT